MHDTDRARRNRYKLNGNHYNLKRMIPITTVNMQTLTKYRSIVSFILKSPLNNTQVYNFDAPDL